jgi:glucose-1-phosphate thymidylyltransferase
MKNWKLLYEGIDHVLTQPKNKGEYYLTDAFQYMIDKGAKIKVIEVSGWYDAGEVGTLLDTNRTVLEKGGARRPKSVPSGVTINDPVYIEDDVTMSNSTIGPNVSLGAGTTVNGSTLSDTVIGKRSKVANSTLSRSLIGDDVTIDGMIGELNITDHSRIKGA